MYYRIKTPPYSPFVVVVVVSTFVAGLERFHLIREGCVCSFSIMVTPSWVILSL